MIKYTPILLLLVLPIMVYAQTTDDTSTVPNNSIEPTDNIIGPTGIVDELQRGHSIITDIMINQSKGIQSDLIFTLSYIDPDKNELVVGFDPSMGYLPSKDAVWRVIDDEIPIRTTFAVMYNEGSNIDIDAYNGCINPNQNQHCAETSIKLQKLNYIFKNNQWLEPTQSPLDRPTIIPDQSNNKKFQDRFNNLDKWIQDNTYSDQWNIVDNKATCNGNCSMFMKTNLDLRLFDNVKLNINRSLNGTFTIYVWDGDSWVNEKTWDGVKRKQSKNININNYTNINDFSVKITVSGIGEISNMRITGERVTSNTNDNDGDRVLNNNDDCINLAGMPELNGCPDTAPPVISIPINTMIVTNNTNSNFYFFVSATDDIDRIVIPTCNNNDYTFNVGIHNITCIVSDSSGNINTESFFINITKQEFPKPVIILPDDITIITNRDRIDVTWDKINAKDYMNRSLNVTCVPNSNSTFIKGVNTVTCTAIDINGGITTKSFQVTIQQKANMRFYGGNIFQSIFMDSSNNKNSTITIGVTTKNNIKGVVVSGHVTSAKDVIENYRLVNNNNIAFINYDNIQFKEKTLNKIDAIFIPIVHNSITVPTNKIQMLNGNIISVSDGTLSELPRGVNVNIYGAYSNTNGILLYKNASSYDSSVSTYTNMGIALYKSQPGDSGAPIIYHNNTTSEIIGVHQGGVCIFDDLSVNQTRIDVTEPIKFRDGSNIDFCGEYQPNNPYYYRIFSAWENVKSELNLR